MLLSLYLPTIKYIHYYLNYIDQVYYCVDILFRRLSIITLDWYYLIRRSARQFDVIVSTSWLTRRFDVGQLKSFWFHPFTHGRSKKFPVVRIEWQCERCLPRWNINIIKRGMIKRSNFRRSKVLIKYCIIVQEIKKALGTLGGVIILWFFSNLT